MFVHFTKISSRFCFVLVIFLYIFPVQGWFYHCTWIVYVFYLYYCASYNRVCIDMSVYVIKYNCLLLFILFILSCIYPMFGLLFHCIAVTFARFSICLWLLYLCVLQYFSVLHTISPWLWSIMGSLSWIFPGYYFLCCCSHPL